MRVTGAATGGSDKNYELELKCKKGNKLLTSRKRTGSIPTSILGSGTLVGATLARPGTAVGRIVEAGDVELARLRTLVQKVRNSAFIAQERSWNHGISTNKIRWNGMTYRSEDKGLSHGRLCKPGS